MCIGEWGWGLGGQGGSGLEDGDKSSHTGYLGGKVSLTALEPELGFPGIQETKLTALESGPPWA